MSSQHPRAGLWSCGLSLYGWILPGPKWPPYWTLLRYQARLDLYEILEIGQGDTALKEYLDIFMLYNDSRYIGLGLGFRGYGLWARTGSRLGVRVLFPDILKSPWMQFKNANIGWTKKRKSNIIFLMTRFQWWYFGTLGTFTKYYQTEILIKNYLWYG